MGAPPNATRNAMNLNMLRILSDEDVSRIHLGSLDVLNDVEIVIHHELALQGLREAGAIVDHRKVSIVSQNTPPEQLLSRVHVFSRVHVEECPQFRVDFTDFILNGDIRDPTESSYHSPERLVRWDQCFRGGLQCWGSPIDGLKWLDMPLGPPRDCSVNT